MKLAHALSLVIAISAMAAPTWATQNDAHQRWLGNSNALFEQSGEYVCICHGATERAVRTAAQEGCRALDELTMRLGEANYLQSKLGG